MLNTTITDYERWFLKLKGGVHKSSSYSLGLKVASPNIIGCKAIKKVVFTNMIGRKYT